MGVACIFLQETGPATTNLLQKNRKNQNCVDRINPTLKETLLF